MAYEFTKLSEVPVSDTVSDECSVLVEDGGDIKRTAKSNIGKAQVQADWNVTDSTDPAFIKNRPFGIVDGEVVFSAENIVWSGTTGDYPYKATFNNEEFTGHYEDLMIVVDDTTYDSCVIDYVSNSQGLCLTLSIPGCPIKVETVNMYTKVQTTITSKSTDITSVKVINPNEQGIAKIDKKYLPDQVKSDWNENDSTSPAYILNKPESLGGGVTWFSASGNDASMIIRAGKEWNIGAPVTGTEIMNAFDNGVVRCKITHVSCCGVYRMTGIITSYDDSPASTVRFFIRAGTTTYQSEAITK